MTDEAVRRGYVTILHISDLHFGAEDADRRSALYEDAQLLKPDIICVTGDIVNWPRRRHLEAAREYLETLRNIPTPAGDVPRLYVVPGNHDAFLGLRGFRRRLALGLTQRNEIAFADLIRIRDQPICIFGLNSTWFSRIPNLQNKGRVNERRLREFRNRIAALSQTRGGEFTGARKIVLLHHHPLPTVARGSSDQQFESMLFLQNAGRVLTELAGNDVSIILHGHQHQPCDFLLDYNVGAGAKMVILSAGTTLKQLPANDYRRAQYYVLNLYSDRVYIESRSYHGGKKRFIPTKGGMRDLPVEPMADCSFNRTYQILDNETLQEDGEMSARATAGQRVSSFKIGFGVDERTPPAPLGYCGLEVRRDGVQIGSEYLRMLRDEPRERLVEVRLDPPLKHTVNEKISWAYRWEKGWQNLFAVDRDSGSYFVDRRLSNVTIRVCSQITGLKAKVEPIAHPDWQITQLSDGFTVSNPPLSHQIFYDVSLKR